MKRSDSGLASRKRDVLVVDDEPDIRELLELTLIRMGLGVDTAGSIAEAKGLLDHRKYDLCLTDMRLSDGEGLEIVRHISNVQPEVPVAVITAYGSAESAVAALKAGAFDYVSKPVGLEQLRALVRSALSLPEPRAPAGPEQRLIGESPPLALVRDLIGRLARTQAPIYISGESGSGKELAAQLVHENGARRTGPFVPVNCGAIPESLMESEFFGHRKGAFTGADQDRDGFFQAANGGTLFLDEVADLPLHMQVKLLRAIQEKRVRKIGDTREDPVDVRIISATHRDLSRCVTSGTFRQDLYYRLNVIELHMPPLRDCRGDIPPIAAAILQRLAQRAGGSAPRLTESALGELMQYDFPGNIRELENILERAVALCASDRIEVADLRLHPSPAQAVAAVVPGAEAESVPLPDFLDRVEREAIESALAETGFNRTAAARRLGITFRQLRYRMKRLGIREARRDTESES